MVNLSGKSNSLSMLEVRHIIINIAEQRLYCIDRNENIFRKYLISTASLGCGNQEGSFKTPLGKHSIAQKIGDGCPINEVFVGREAQGVLSDLQKLDKPLPDDIITSRILWLKGEQDTINQGVNNKGELIDSYQRYIYIHGTSEESKIGAPASHGCIRMRNKDVIELYDLVKEGCYVDIQEK